MAGKAGITKKMTFHDLRHTYGTNQIDAGTDIFTLKGNMSHQDVNNTQRYSNESKRRKMEAANKVN
jgi:site-specific recombinase XerD